MKVPQEISEKFITANSYHELRDVLIRIPFCFNKVKKISKEMFKLRQEGWEMVYEIYPEIRGKKIQINTSKNEVELLPNDPTTATIQNG